MKTQAWGWLAAAVLAAGLNSSYHNGDLQWAHEIIDQVGHNTSAVLALATGRADEFLAQARMLNVDRSVAPTADVEVVAKQDTRCPLSMAMAEVQNSFDQPQIEFDRFQAMSARQQARLVRLEANRIRIENHVRAKLAHLRVAEVNFNPAVAMDIPKIDCPRVHVTVPRMPRMKMPVVPVVHVEYSGSGPV